MTTTIFDFDGNNFLILDGVSRIVETVSDRVTTHALEDGENVGDHVRKGPVGLSVRGEINTSSLVQGQTQGNERLSEAREFLSDMRGRLLLVAADDRLEDYDNMVVQRSGATLNPGATAIVVDLQFLQVRIADAQVTVLPSETVTGFGLTPEQDAGQQSTTDGPGTGSTEDQRVSILSSLLGRG